MPASLRLYRRPMYERLERLATEWDKLTYCRFCIQAEREINPDWLDNVDYNFSALESIRGYAGRELLIDNGRGKLVPDRNLTTYFTTIRNQWNNDLAHHYVQLYVVRHEGIITKKPTKFKPERSRAVIYNFLQTLRGRGAVGDVVRRFDDGTAGLNEAKDRVRDSIRVSKVDNAVQRILEENAQIQGR